jgi:nucleotide-binding universal stress UspA family protein
MAYESWAIRAVRVALSACVDGIGLADDIEEERGGGVMADRLFTKILVPVDFSPCSEEAFRIALSFARSYQAEVLLLHVVDTKSLDALNRLGLAPASDAAKQKKQLHHFARLNARELLARDEAKGINIKRLLADGCPFEEIARTARVEGVDLVVMGSYGGAVGGVEKIFFGSTAEKVVRTAGCPVLTVPLPVKRTKVRTSKSSS